MSKTNGSTPPTANIDDPGEFNQIQSLKRIHRARDRVADQRSKIIESSMVGNLRQEKSFRLYYEAVCGYIMEIEPLLSSLDAGEEYMSEVLLVDTEIEPPAEAVDVWEDRVMPLPDGHARPEAHSVVIQGLEDFINVGSVISASWRVVYPNGSGIESEMFDIQQPMPRRASDYAYRLTNRFLRDIGLDAKLENVRETKDIEWGSTRDDEGH